MLDALLAIIPGGKLAALAAAALAVLGWVWNTKRVSFNKGVAEERAKTDAANNELLKDKSDADQAVDRLPPVDARDELSKWSKG